MRGECQGMVGDGKDENNECDGENDMVEGTLVVDDTKFENLQCGPSRMIGDLILQPNSL